MMKLQIERIPFLKALGEIAPFAPEKTPLAVLKYARITTKGNRMKLEAHDTQCAITKYITLVGCDTDDTFLIPIVELNRLVAKIKDNSIGMEIDGDNIKVIHSAGTAEFQSAESESFPVFTIPETDLKVFDIAPDLLVNAIQKGKGFVAKDQIRPVMTAIYSYIKDGMFGYCASDTHKLIHGEVSTDSSEDVNWLVMPQIFSPLINAIRANIPDTVRITIAARTVMYRIGNTIISSVMYAGDFPNFRRVIPTTHSIDCTVGKTGMTESLNRLSLFTDITECIKMGINMMDMVLTAQNVESAKSATEHLSHNGCNGEIEIGVNVKSMVTGTDIFPDGDISMWMNSPSHPILMMSKGDESVKVLVMPMSMSDVKVVSHARG